MKLLRRDFIKSVLGAAAGVSFFSTKKAVSMGNLKKFSDLLGGSVMHKLGKTGLNVYPIGFGGIVVMNTQPEDAQRIVAKAVEDGVNYFDVAPSYGDAEVKLGPALKPFRKEVFLACKTQERTAEGAKANLDNSLKNLQTDHFDVYQLHAITDVEKDVKAVFAKGGAMEVILDAKKAGIIKYVGFSAHSPKAALAAMNEYDFDTMMYPINFCTHFGSGFEDAALKEAKKRNMGIIALKALAKQQWQSPEDKARYPKCWYEPIDDEPTALLALSWTKQQGVSVMLPPGDERLFNLAMKLLPQCKPLTESEIEVLKNTTAKLAPIFTA
jgi:aryl-alcohol dehydrogenase-like predicted oxidoreductase